MKNPKKTNSDDLNISWPKLPDVEDAVIGSLLSDFGEAEKAIETLKDEDFTQPGRKAVFVAVRLLQEADRPVNLTTVIAQLTEMKALDEAGGLPCLAALSANIGSVSQVEYYVQLLRQQSLVRRVITSCVETIQDSQHVKDVDGFVNAALSRMEDACRREGPSAAMPIGVVLDECIKEFEAIRQSGVIPGVPTGYPSLDSLLGGWKPGEYCIIAARPGVGKSLFALILAIHAAEKGVPVAFFSYEMKNIENAKRVLMLSTGISTTEMNNPNNLTDERMRFLKEAAKASSKLPIFLEDTFGLTLGNLVFSAKQLVRHRKVGLIVIDYLQLINHTDNTIQTREQVVSAISRRIKMLAGEMNVPVIALSQVSRQAVRNGTGVPDLSELRESGSLEQDTDKVLFIRRPEGSGAGAEYAGGEVDVIVAKNRHGSPGTVRMKVNSKTLCFEDPAQDIPEFETVQGTMW